MSVGLERGTVQLQVYDPGWANEYEQERQRLLDVFGNKLIAIEHIGSTSVPGLSAKPIIDMIAAVDSFDDLKGFIEPLQKLGYEYMPQRMFDDRKFFPKGSRSNRTHHLNIVLKDDVDQWDSPLLFREYLRNHQDARDEYARLKSMLAEEYGDSREMYTKSKDDFIHRTIGIARQEGRV